MAGLYNIKAQRNNDLVINMNLTDNNSNPIDTTNWKGRMQVRPQKRSTNVILDLSSSNGDITFGHDNNNNGIKITKSAKDLIQQSPINEGYYDLVIEDNNGKIYTLLEGTFTLEDGVTTSLP